MALLLASPIKSQAQTTDFRVVYLCPDSITTLVNQAFKTFRHEHPDLESNLSLTLLTHSTFDYIDPSDVLAADLLVFDMHEEMVLKRFNQENNIDLIASIANKAKLIAVGSGISPKEKFTEKGAHWDIRAAAYREFSGFENQYSLFKYSLKLAGIYEGPLSEPKPSHKFGYYYPLLNTPFLNEPALNHPSRKSGAPNFGKIYPNWEEYAAAHPNSENRPRVAVPFFPSSFYSGEMAPINFVIEEIIRQGAYPIPIFGYPADQTVEKLLLDNNGQPRADVAVSFLFRFANFDAHKALAKANIPTINLMSLYGRSESDWRESAEGLTAMEASFQIVTPELAGLIAPTVGKSREKILDIETGNTLLKDRPITERISMAVSRALSYSKLKHKPNEAKKVALIYYNYPAGKANIGASYLNVAESLAQILNRLKQEGYDTGDRLLNVDEILQRVTTEGYNIGSYGPGELETLVKQGRAELISLTQYQAWLDGYPTTLRNKVIADWGGMRLPSPEQPAVMNYQMNGGPHLVIPTISLGNITLLPQPIRGWGEDLDKLYHAKDLTPHPQYIATYEWLKHTLKADAIIHIGTHGTLEWLDGKALGQTPEDASDALLDAMPNLYLYNVDVVGEGLVAKRRGLATLLDHMVPPFTEGGLYPQLAELNEELSDYHRNHHKNPELARQLEADIIKKVKVLGLEKDLDIPAVQTQSGIKHLDHSFVHALQDYIIELKKTLVPYGLHTYGSLPEDALIDSTVKAIMSIDRTSTDDPAQIDAKDMKSKIETSAVRELDHLMKGLAGGYVPVGTGVEPIRNPDAYPTGKNFYGIDPAKVPKKAAWKIGSKLAQDLLDDHKQKEGHYPKKLSFVIWGNETIRHEGVMESQILYLMGAKPVWDAKGKVVDIAIIPKHQLNRPRIDIIIASAAEGMFNNITLLIDKAVQQIKLLDEADNYLRQHVLATQSKLVDKGYSPEEALQRASVRIFDEPPGVYNLNTSRITANSGSWDSDISIAHDYIMKMGHGFGNGFWGEPMADVFRLTLAGTEKVIHSRSSNLYGMLDNDDGFMYVGGLAVAIRDSGDTNPDIMLTDTSDPGRATMTSLDRFMGKEFRSRYINPTWIKGMQAEGYAGAVEMRNFFEYLWGWEATVQSVVAEDMWQAAYETYINDQYGLELRAFFQQHSPYAFQDIAARLLETIRKEGWTPDMNTREALTKTYIEHVLQNGIACSDHTCGNPRLLKHVMDQARQFNVPMDQIAQLKKLAEDSIGGSIEVKAKLAKSFVASNEAKIAEIKAAPTRRQTNTPSDGEENPHSGYVMEKIEQPQERSSDNIEQIADDEKPSQIVLALMIVGLLLLWRAYHRRRQ